jgi:hypothetical protein
LLLQECDFARYSLDRLQKQTRVTRMHELEAELRMVRDEVRRHMALNKVMQQRMVAAQSQAESFAQQAQAAASQTRKQQKGSTGRSLVIILTLRHELFKTSVSLKICEAFRVKDVTLTSNAAANLRRSARRCSL